MKDFLIFGINFLVSFKLPCLRSSRQPFEAGSARQKAWEVEKHVHGFALRFDLLRSCQIEELRNSTLGAFAGCEIR